jgi:general secretion pathway protein K
LLVATLAFVALSITEKTSLAAARSVNERARAEAVWRALGSETLALEAIETVYSSSDGKMSLDDPWATEPVEVPMEGGGARIFFADNTACFNINRLSASNPEDAAPGSESGAVKEFSLLIRNLGLGEYEGVALAEIIADWTDVDSSRRPQGAEDEYYTTLPSPYRTANQPIQSVTELRAMKGVTRPVYAALKPYLCAQPGTDAQPVNINMLTQQDAPILAAILGEDVTVLQAEDIIAARPPGGYPDVGVFMESSAIQALEPGEELASRFDVGSRYFQARAEIIYETALLEMTSDIVIGENGEARVVMRRFGAEE